MKKLGLIACCLAILAQQTPVQSGERDYLNCHLKIDASRQRDLNQWKVGMQDYSKRHYGENTWQLEPKVIVMHYTVSPGFPWNLVNTQSFAGEKPGLGVHYVIQGKKVWQILPPNVRSRGAYGINHRAVNIEMVAMTAEQLAQDPYTLKTASQLVGCLMHQYNIPLSKVYAHSDVAKMDKAVIPEVLDLIDDAPYGRSDPGVQNMQTLMRFLKGK